MARILLNICFHLLLAVAFLLFCLVDSRAKKDEAHDLHQTEGTSKGAYKSTTGKSISDEGHTNPEKSQRSGVKVAKVDDGKNERTKSQRKHSEYDGKSTTMRKYGESVSNTKGKLPKAKERGDDDPQRMEVDAIVEKKKLEAIVGRKKIEELVGRGKVVEESKERGAYPRYFLLGAHKAATHSLHKLLASHPDICSRRQWRRSNQFFEVARNFQIMSNVSYQSNFRWCKKPKAQYLDGAVGYLPNPEVPLRMNSTFGPDHMRAIRAIVVLREPVDREFSAYGQALQQCSEHVGKMITKLPPTNTSTICGTWQCRVVGCEQSTNKSSLSVGLHRREIGFGSFEDFFYNAGGGSSHYATYLRNYLKVLHRKQIFIVNMVTLVEEPAETLHRLERFLEISTFFNASTSLPHLRANAKSSAVMSCVTRDALAQLYALPNADLYALLREPGAPSSEPFFPPFPDPAYRACNTD